MTTTMNTNGVRRTLSSQLDRLDNILDTLSGGLNEAVAGACSTAVGLAVRQAVEQAVKEAVEAVLKEILTNQDLRAALRDVASPEAAPEQPPQPPSTPRAVVRRVCDWARDQAGHAKDACIRLVHRTLVLRPVAAAAWQLVQRSRTRLLAACGVGVAAGVITYVVGPWLGVAAAWATGFATTLACMARDSVRRVLTATFATD